MAVDQNPEPDDLMTVMVACFDSAAAIAVAERAGDSDAMNMRLFAFVAQKLCDFSDEPVAIELIAKVAGPYADHEGDLAEVWSARSETHDQVFVFVAVTAPRPGEEFEP